MSAVRAMCDSLVAERLADLASERWEVPFTAYLNGLQRTHGDDPAMAAHIRRCWALMDGRDGT